MRVLFVCLFVCLFMCVCVCVCACVFQNRQRKRGVLWEGLRDKRNRRKMGERDDRR